MGEDPKLTSEVEVERVIYFPTPSIDLFVGNSIRTCKYTPLTFLPKNLWYQFQKLPNIYFSVVAILQIIPEISVSDGVPNILLPLAFVILVSAIKDGLEDRNRQKSDDLENNRKVLAWRGEAWGIVKWKDLRVGDLVKIMKDEFFPADLVLIATCEPNGLCYIETKNIDGETNLKHKLSNKNLNSLLQNENKIENFFAEIVCEGPNPMIYQFKGKVTHITSDYMLGTEQFLLRGSSLKNTDWVLGIVVYTGHQTKIMLNSSKSKNKRSFLESQMYVEIFNIFILQLVICFFSAIVYVVWYHTSKNDTEQYLELKESNDHEFVIFILLFFSWFLIFTNFVPISLMVTLEVVKFMQGIFIAWDIKIYYEPTDTPAGAQSSNLIEELGQVNIIFSDKTGTLTCNIMEFRKFCVNGVSYGTNKRLDPNSKIPNVDFVDSSFDPLEDYSQEFLVHLAVCHTAVTEKVEDRIEYKASSPDELALISAAKYFGVVMQGRDADQGVILSIHGIESTYQILNIIEFSSNRRRMSVITKFPDGRIFLFCKGADNVILPRLRKERNIEKTWESLENYASEGLRTLVLGSKELTTEDYEKWNNEYIEAMSDIKNREKRVSEVTEKLERDLLLIGVTAIEDKLQEDVPSTIAYLQESGIKIWVLTGDKIETAIDIGFSSSLLTNEMSRSIVDGTTEYIIKGQLGDAMNSSSHNFSKFALVISGDSLLRILNSDLVFILIRILEKADVILACRVSPQQKSDLVLLVRDIDPKARTLSIGDGANDVNMILAAHVGVGIAGVEGNQAVRASDYSIAQFSYLKRLLFTHGRECYRRNANLICYNFYKNVLIVIPLLVYGIFSAFSGQILYNMWTYQLYNVTFTSWPIIIYAIFDRDKNYYDLEQNPDHYKLGMKGKLFNREIFWKWVVEGSIHGIIIMITVAYVLAYSVNQPNGKVAGMWEISDLTLSLVIIIANVKILTFSYTWYWFSVLIIILSIGSYFIIAIILTQWITISDYLDNYDGRGSTVKILQMPNTYAIILLVQVGFLLTDPLIKYTKKLFKLRSPSTKYKSIPNKFEDQDDFEDDLPLSTYTPLISQKHTGFAFSGEPGHSPQITDPEFRR
jgi:phospholipid-transporting ATPase